MMGCSWVNKLEGYSSHHFSCRCLDSWIVKIHTNFQVGPRLLNSKNSYQFSGWCLDSWVLKCKAFWATLICSPWHCFIHNWQLPTDFSAACQPAHDMHKQEMLTSIMSLQWYTPLPPMLTISYQSLKPADQPAHTTPPNENIFVSSMVSLHSISPHPLLKFFF